MKNILPLIEKKIVKSFLILSALLLCFDNLWAQPTPSTSTELNLYRLRNGNGTTYYMVPVGTTDGSYVKTSNSTTGDDLNNVNRISAYWYFEQSGTQYYIRNLATGQYLYCPTVTQGANRVTLQSSTSSNKTLFTFTSLTGNGQTYYAILPQGASDQSLAPNNGTSTANGNNIGLYLYNYYPAVWNYTDKVTSTLQGGLSDFTISGNTTLDTLITTNYSHTNASYTSPHFEFTINSTTYYKGATGNPSTTAPTGSTTGITYAWTLSDNMTGYATVSNTGAVTYSTLVPEASRTATLTCTATHTSSGTTNTATYTITFVNPTILQEPVISYTVATASSLEVTLSHPTTGVTIYYTTDGSDPLTSTTRAAYTAPFNVNNNTTVKAYAVKTDMTSSTVASKLIQISSGIVGNSVIVNDYEDHNWSYYKGLDYTLEDGTTTYKDKYRYSIYSPDPRNVKITYRGYNTTSSNVILNNASTAISTLNANTSPRVSNSETQNTFVYYETLEKFVIGFFTQHQTDGDYDGTPANPNNTAEQYPYTVISNPFSVRPSKTSGGSKTYYGFAGWKIIAGGEYILNHNNGDVLALDEIIHFTNLNDGYTPNCTSAEVVFEATWATANVQPTNSAYSSFPSSGTYETNFIVATGNINSITQTQPCTITAYYPDGTAYDANSATITITGLTVNTSGSTPATNTVKVEWIRHGNGTFNANGKNMILGRGITSSSSSNQGTIYCNNANQACVNIVKIESGYYNKITPINAEISSTQNVNTYLIFGCDYDKVFTDYYVDDVTTSAYNTKLRVGTSMNWSGMGQVHREHGELYLRTLFKSGIFDGQYYTHRSSHTGQRFVTIEGGYFTNNITGGSETDETQPNARSFTLRAKGNFRVDGRIAGGSDHNYCSGDRCMIFTGGRIGGWIAAGSNSGTETGGVTTGETFIYAGGTTEVNSRQFDAPGTAIFNKSSGGVIYGSGCGINHNSTAGGVTKGSNIVLADNAYVERGIYGGGAMGRISEGSPAHIYILGGKVGTSSGTIQDGSTNMTVSNAGVFGGACNVGGGYSYIFMNGGIVESGIYGGSNINGSMDNNTNVKIVGGQVGYATANANVHGGGLGNDTRVLGSVNVTIGNSGATTGATIYGDVYGGSAEGKTNGNTSPTTGATTQVTLNAGTIKGNLYGGGLGTSTHAADVYGPVSVSVTGGKANNVFGCNNTNGAPKNSVSVSITGGEVLECVYGGGNAAPYNAGSLTSSPTVTMNGGKVDQHVFGGGLGSTAIITGNTIVSILDGLVKGNVYGGGNGGAVTGNTNVTIGSN